MVRCVPPAELKDGSGNWLPYATTLTFSDDTVLPDKPVGLRCTGTASGCPTPVIAAGPAWTIAPQGGVTLVGSGSHALGGKKIAKYQWTLLKAPEGASNVGFHPAANLPSPKLGVKRKGKVNGVLADVVALDVAGDYQVRLVVTDDQGVVNCLPATETVHVIPEAAVFAELVWSTPADPTPDTGPGMGADLDLHFAHPGAGNAKKCASPPAMCAGKPCPCQPDNDGDGAVDPWFHPLYDCFWNNPKPNWGSVDPLVDDDPSLDLDDTDGFGPETLHLNAPQYGSHYAIGVHSWDAHDYGPSMARVRVWVGGLLQAVVQRKLGECDLWWATAVAWPKGVTPIASDGKGDGKVVVGYKSTAVGLVNGKCGAK